MHISSGIPEAYVASCVTLNQSAHATMLVLRLSPHLVVHWGILSCGKSKVPELPGHMPKVIHWTIHLSTLALILGHGNNYPLFDVTT